MTPALSVSHLRKTYGAKMAVADLSFAVAPGEVVGLLGPNGAGKTTTISMIFGVLAPDSGDVAITGIDLKRQRAAALGRANFAAVYAPLPGNLTVEQNLRVFGLLYDVRHLGERIETLLRDFDLVKFRRTRCGVLSSGEQTRACLAKAMLNEPALLLLDEPTASLDPAIARTIRQQIRAIAHDLGTGVLWTSHNMAEVEEACDRVLFLADGRILLDGDPKALPERHGHASLEDLFIAVAHNPAAMRGTLSNEGTV